MPNDHTDAPSPAGGAPHPLNLPDRFNRSRSVPVSSSAAPFCTHTSSATPWFSRMIP